MKDREEYISILEQDNAELNKKYLNAVTDYETTMFEKVQLNRLVNSCQEEIRQLKKQLEECKDKINWYENFEVNKTIDKLRLKHNIQQKEFIKYLEDETSKWHNNYDSYNYEYEIEEPTAEELVNEISQKYKSIIGVSDENNNE